MERDNEKTRKEDRVNLYMDPLNIFVLFNIIATFGANFGGARKGLKSSIVPPKEKPKTVLQWLPVLLSILTLVCLILGVFQVGTLQYKNSYWHLRLIGMIVYLVFSWIQIWSYKALGDNYSQNVLIFRSHKLIEKGPFRIIRHPQYLSQILMDLGGGLATLSYLIIPLAIIEIPFLIFRASLEEKLLSKNFKDAFTAYKKKTGFMFPFIG